MQKDEAAHLHQFILHASLDIVQDVVWNTNNMYVTEHKSHVHVLCLSPLFCCRWLEI